MEWRESLFLKTLPEKKQLVKVCTLLLLLSLLFLREPLQFIHPGFWAEDGTRFYTDAFFNGPHSLLKTYAGYLHIYIRLIALFSTLFPLQFAAAVFLAGAVLSNLFLYCITFSERLELRFETKIALALSVVLVPAGGEVFLNLTNSQWIGSLALIIILSFSPPQKTSQVLFDTASLLVLGFSGPFLIVYFPLFFLKEFASWRLTRGTWGRGSVLRLLLVLLIVVCHASMVEVAERITDGQPGSSRYLDIPEMMFNLVATYLLGWQERIPLVLGNKWLAVTAPALIFVTFLVLNMRKGPEREELRVTYKYSFTDPKLATLLFILVAGFGVYVSAMAFSPVPILELQPFGGGQRYTFNFYITLTWFLIFIIFEMRRAMWWQRFLVGFAKAGLLLGLVTSATNFHTIYSRAAPGFFETARAFENSDRVEQYFETSPRGFGIAVNKKKKWNRLEIEESKRVETSEQP